MSGGSNILSPGSLGTPDDEDQPPSRTKSMAESKSASKCVRVLTVLAYMLSVSMAAILLSLYYIFLWNPPPPMNCRDANQTCQKDDAAVDD